MCTCTSVTHHGHVCLCTHPLKLEVGKTYVSNSGANWKILFKDGEYYIGRPDRLMGGYRKFKENGNMNGYASSFGGNLLKEYREPKVTKRDVVLYEDVTFTKRGLPGTTGVMLLNVGYGMGEWPYLKEISRQTVTFTE